MGNRPPGYEYRYRFGTDDKMISDEMIYPFRTQLSLGVSVFLFEIRTNFILKRRRAAAAADDDDEKVMCFESLNVYANSNDGGRLAAMTRFRLEDYWMSEDEFKKFVHGAWAFATQTISSPSPSPRVIPLVVGIDVCTVQQEGEELAATMDRAISGEFLVPLYLQPRTYGSDYLVEFLWTLSRIRVEDVDEGLRLMEICSICLRNPTIGAHISHVPCYHAFHTHCIVKWLLKSNSCPLCRLQAHNFPIKNEY